MLFSPARVLSQNIVDLIPDALVIRLEETFCVSRGEVALNVNVCKSGPLRKYLIQILDELILALAGNNRLRDSGVYRVPVKFKIGVQEHLMEERTDFLEFKEHAGPVVFVKVLRCVLRRQHKALDDFDLHRDIFEYLSGDRILDFIYILLLYPVL